MLLHCGSPPWIHVRGKRSRGEGYERLLLKSFFMYINMSVDKRRRKDDLDGKEFYQCLLPVQSLQRPK